MHDFEHAYIAAGGNRHPSAADWDAHTGLLAFGADRNVALWSPSVLCCYSVCSVLAKDTDRILCKRVSDISYLVMMRM